MLSSRINLDDDDDDDDEGESTMPGGYEPWPRVVSRIAPSTTVPPPRPRVPPTSRPSQRPPIAASKTRPSVTPTISPVRSRRSRRRSITPEIVIERRHRHHRSLDRHRIITIPLDYHPTLGLRGPPTRVLEIERVRCRRRRKSRSSCYEVDYDVPPSPPLQAQPNFIVANSMPNSFLPTYQSSLMASASNSAASLALLSNLTPEMIENLPKQTIHLPPIHLPGSQADANTELHTVIFPAEIINPIDGTLSIIQPNRTINGSGIANIQPSVPISAQPQLTNVPTNVKSALASFAMTSGPFMQQVQDLLQRVTLSQTHPALAPSSYPIIQPSLPVMPQNNAATNSFYNPQTIPPINTTNTGFYPPANIRPTHALNIGSYNSTSFTPSSRANITPYRPANITPYQPASNIPAGPANITPYRPANIAPYQPASRSPAGPANITTYRPANITPYQPASSSPAGPASITSYRPANITPYQPASSLSAGPASITPYRPANITPYQLASSLPAGPASITPYRPANITPYQPAGSSPAGPANITSYRPENITPYHPTSTKLSNPINTRTSHSATNAASDFSDIGPYRPANITPYSAISNRSGGSSILPPSIPSGSTPYISSSSLVSSGSFSSYSSDINNSPINIPYSSQSLTQTSSQSGNSMPKSILRNAPSYDLSNTTYTHLNSPSVSSPNGIVRKMTTFA